MRLGIAIAPVALYCATLKIIRVVAVEAEIGALARAFLVTPDLLFMAGFAALAWTAVRIALGRGRVVAFALVQILAACMGVVATTAHRFFFVTGASLDFSIFAFAAKSLADTGAVVASEMPLSTWIGAVGLPAVVLLLPWLLVRRTDAPPRPLGRGAAALWAAGALGLTALSAVPSVEGVTKAFARDPSLNLLLGALATEEHTDDIEPGEPRPRGATRLVEDEPGARRPNIVIFVMESTRADALTVYTPDLASTPFLAEMAKESVVVERVYSQVPHTSKALTSILCGYEPRLTLEVVEAREGGLPGPCLPSLLAKQMGYRTAFFQSATGKYEDRAGLVKNMGYQHFEHGDQWDHAGFEKANYFGYEDAIMLDPAKRWLNANVGRGAPLLITYLTLTPHHDYLAPKRRYGRVRLAKGDKMNRYLNTVRYLDFLFKDIVDQFKELGLYENTVFLAIGDHGEAFGEHKLWLHDDVMYDEGLRVPFMLHAPGLAAERIEGPASIVDTVPTLLDVLGLSIAEGSVAGHSVLELPEDHEVRAACYRKFQCLAGVRGTEKFVHYFGNRPDELFDLSNDPKEKRNLIGMHAWRAEQWRRDLVGWGRAVHELYKPLESGAGAAKRFLYSFKGPPKPKRPLAATFGEDIELLGLDPPKRRYRRGKRMKVNWYMRALRPLPRGHRLVVFGKLTRKNGDTKEVRWDHVPGRGLLPLEEWPTDKWVKDHHTMRIFRNWPVGELSFCLALTAHGDRRIPLTSGPHAGKDCLPIDEVSIVRSKKKKKKKKGKKRKKR